jgi:branched-chain amino acid transport system ATP-binding protein
LERSKVLEVEKISVSYGVVQALRNVSIEVDKGEIVCLLGANNVGKSTLLSTILGINHVDSGKVIFCGKDITSMPTEKIVASGICLLPEGRGILPSMTVMENLQLGAYHHKYNLKKNAERVFTRLPRLYERRKQMAKTLSGGEQQMLSIGRGLMSEPVLMMFDEPSLGLSPILVDEVFNIIVDLNSEGYTILLAEQNARKALKYSHRGYVFTTGTIKISGTAEELANNEQVQRAYLGGGVG